MPQLKSEQIRNISIIGHGGTGKTILSEGMLYTTGVTNRFGKIEEGNTVSDYHKDEIEKQISINSCLLNTTWKDSKDEQVKLNIIDTPGYMDFVGEVKSALKVTDTALIVLDAFKGVEVGTESCFKFTKENGNNVIFVVNKLDSDNAEFEDTVSHIKESFGSEAVVLQYPVNEGSGFDSIVDILRMKMLKFKKDAKGEYTEEEIPEDLKEKANDYHQKFLEAIAEEDEELLEKFFAEGESFTDEEIKYGLRKGMRERMLFPVFCTAAHNNVGVRPLLDFIAEYTESPLEKPAVKGVKPNTEESVEVLPKEDGEPILFVFKTISEQNIGELSFFRVLSGNIQPGTDVINGTNGKSERLSQFYSVNGKDRTEMQEIVCGDIAGVVKLKNTHANNTLSSKSFPFVLDGIDFPEPNMSLAIIAKRKGDEDKIATGLHSLHEEDPTFTVTYNPETSQTVISGQGELHLNTLLNRMKEKYNLDIDVENPKIPYKETIQSLAEDVEYRHKKQSGGRGQFAHIHIKVEPLERGEGFEFVNKIVGGVVPGRFIPAVEKGVTETMKTGVMIGCQVVDVKVTLFDGSFHTVDSDELSFKLASSQAFRKGFKNARPVLLEPVYNVDIAFPEEFMGAVSGDVSSRRGRIQGMETEGRLQVIKCQMPLSEMNGYSSRLRSLTQGRGNYTRHFSHYEGVPKEIENQIISDFEKEKEESKS